MYNVDWAAIRNGVGRADVATAGAREARGRSRWLPQVSPVVWSLGFTSLLTDVSSEMISSILPIYLLLHLHVSPAAFGVIDGLYQGFALLVRAAAGVLGDRWQRHKAIAALGYGMSAACRLGMLIVGPAWTGIAAVVAIDRTGKGIRTAPRDALISLATPRGELARAFGVHRALDAAGAMIGPLAAFAILVAVPRGFDVIFVASFCVALLGVGVITLFVREARAADQVERAASDRSVFWMLWDSRVRGIALTAGLLSLATISDAFIFLILQEQMGFDAGRFPLLFVGVALVNFALSAPVGYLADRIGRPPVFLAAHLLLLGAYSVLILPAPGIGALCACLVLLGAYYAGTDGVLSAITGAALPRHLCGSGLSIVTTLTNLGRLISSVLFGIAWSGWGVQPALVSFMIGLAGATGVAMLVLRSGRHDATAKSV